MKFIKTYLKASNVNSCMKRLENPPISIVTNVDWNALNTNAKTKAEWKASWPKSMSNDNTQFDVDAVTGELLFSLNLTPEELARLPKNDTPNFTSQYEGEVDEHGDPLPPMTFMVEDKDEDGQPLGTYHRQTITRMA